jgi:hypothetical protein
MMFLGVYIITGSLMDLLEAELEEIECFFVEAVEDL